MTDWWSQGRAGIEEGLRLYSEQTSSKVEGDFEDLCARLQGRIPVHLDQADMRVVAAFKGRGAYLAVKETNVSEVTERGIRMAADGDIEGAVRELCQITGVSIPVASTILTAANPQEFGVIDRLTMGEVIRLLLVRSEAGLASDPALADLGWAAWKWTRDPDDGRPAAYARFTVGLRRRARELAVPVRDLEKALFTNGRAARSFPTAERNEVL